jgi:hypothetical protein
MAAGIESGEFKSGLDAELATNAVLGALNWSHRWFKPGRSTAPDEVAAVFIEIFLNGLVSGPPAQPAPDGGGPGRSRP